MRTHWEDGTLLSGSAKNIVLKSHTNGIHLVLPCFKAVSILASFVPCNRRRHETFTTETSLRTVLACGSAITSRDNQEW